MAEIESTEKFINNLIKQTNVFRNNLVEKVPITYFHSVLKLLFELRKLKKSSLFYFNPIDYEIISVQREKVPEDSILVECYESEDSFVITGHPCKVPDHDCAVMGCTKDKHIIYKFKK